MADYILTQTGAQVQEAINKALAMGSGGGSGSGEKCFVAQPEAPSDTSLLWIDTDDENSSGGDWQVLLDHTVSDRTVYYYTADAKGCSEFIVSVLFYNDSNVASAVNGLVAINATASPWSTGIAVTSNIQSLAYNSAGNNNKAFILSFRVVDGKIIPVHTLASDNAAASSAILSVATANNVPKFKIDKASDNNSINFRTVSSVTNVSVGSYTTWFGVGSKILILGK